MLTVGGHRFYTNVSTAGEYYYEGEREKLTLAEVYARPLLAALGSLELDSARRCKDNKLGDDASSGCLYERGVNIYTICGIFFFLLIVNLVMINLLIAKFSNTVSKSKNLSVIRWLSNRYDMYVDFRESTKLPPPLNFLELMYRFVKWRFRKRCTSKKSPDLEFDMEDFVLLQALRMQNRRKELYTQPVLQFTKADKKDDREITAMPIDVSAGSFSRWNDTFEDAPPAQSKAAPSSFERQRTILPRKEHERSNAAK